MVVYAKGWLLIGRPMTRERKHGIVWVENMKFIKKNRYEQKRK